MCRNSLERKKRAGRPLYSSVIINPLSDALFILCLHRRLYLQPRMRRGWSKSTMSSSSCLLHTTGQRWSSMLHSGGLNWNYLICRRGSEASKEQNLSMMMIVFFFNCLHLTEYKNEVLRIYTPRWVMHYYLQKKQKTHWNIKEMCQYDHILVKHIILIQSYFLFFILFSTYITF